MNNINQDQEVSLKLYVVLYRALQAIDKKMANNFKSYGLNPTEFAVLELLYHKGDQPIQKIGEKILIASSSITYVVDKLEKKNFVKRVACATDRRVTYASITEEGQQLMQDIFPTHAETMAAVMGGLDTDEKTDLIEQLKKLGLYARDFTGTN